MNGFIKNSKKFKKAKNRWIKKYGLENFEKWVILHCKNKESNHYEKIWIKKKNTLYPFGYNLTEGGGGGDTFTNNINKEEIRKKVSEKGKGKRLGVARTEDVKKKISNTLKGRITPEDVKKKISISGMGKNKGKIRTEDVKKRISLTLTGKKHSEQTIKKMSESKKKFYENNISCLKGRIVSEETKLKIRNSLRKRKEEKLNESNIL